MVYFCFGSEFKNTCYQTTNMMNFMKLPNSTEDYFKDNVGRIRGHPVIYKNLLRGIRFDNYQPTYVFANDPFERVLRATSVIGFLKHINKSSLCLSMDFNPP